MSVTAEVVQDETPHSTKKWMIWTGRVLSALPILMLVFSASMKLMHHPMMLESLTNKLGFHESALTSIGLLELVCVALYAFPRTAVLGAVLVTGYLGGAIVAHVRVGEPFIPPLLFGVLAWVGLYLRDARLRRLLPLRA
jgi:hypothetical protein